MLTKDKPCSKCKLHPRRGHGSWCKICKNEYDREFRKNKPKYGKERIQHWKNDMDAWFKEKLRVLKYNSKRIGRECTITELDLRNAYTEFCPIFGTKLIYIKEVGNKFKSNVSVDRIDSTKGYIPGNIWLVSLKANICKSDLTIEELKNLYEQTLKKINDSTTSTT